MPSINPPIEKLSVGWPWKLFLFSLLTIITALVIYLGLAFGYRPFLQSQMEKIDESIRQLSEAIPEDQQKNLIIFYSQLANLQNVLSKHIIVSKIFPFLQKNTNQSVFYNAMDLRVGERKLALEGVAANYDIFSQQLEALNSAPEVVGMVINESTAIGGQVKFKLFVILKPELFK